MGSVQVWMSKEAKKAAKVKASQEGITMRQFFDETLTEKKGKRGKDFGSFF